MKQQECFSLKSEERTNDPLSQSDATLPKCPGNSSCLRLQRRREGEEGTLGAAESHGIGELNFSYHVPRALLPTCKETRLNGIGAHLHELGQCTEKGLD